MQDHETAANAVTANDSSTPESSEQTVATKETADRHASQTENATDADQSDASDQSATETEETSEAAEPAEPEEEEEITYHAVQKEDSVTAIWEMQGRKHIRTIDPRSREGAEILRLFTAEEGEEAAA